MELWPHVRNIMPKSYHIEPVGGGVCGGPKRHKITIKEDDKSQIGFHFCNSYDEATSFVLDAIRKTQNNIQKENYGKF